MKYLQLAHSRACTKLKRKIHKLTVLQVCEFYNKRILEHVQS